MTSIDYVVIALSPALIMALVGSLCFFLLEIGYHGQYGGRLNWIMFWFVFAIVLIARISIEEGKEKALLYGLALSGAVAVAVLRFVDSPFVAWILMAVVWWCANKLTWDCTVIDDEQDASGEGLLQVAGLDRGDASPTADLKGAEAANEAEDGAGRRRRRQVAWWQRWFGAVEADENEKKPHAPGVWVVYFSLAALPLFGLGQSMVPAGDVARRRYVFSLLLCYVAAGLGLLLTTSFLGLRRYLRQRKLEMPPPMTGVWLGVGAVLIVALLLVGVMLPRPSAEYPVEELIANMVGSPKRQASDYAVLTDSHGEGQGRPSSDEPSSKAADQQGGGQQSGGQQSGGQQSGGQQSGGQQSGGQQSGGQQSGGQQSGGQQSGGQQSGGQQSGGQQSGGQQSGGQQSGGQQSGGQQSGGQKNGGQKNDEKQNGGQQSGGQQSGGQQSGGQQSGGQQSGGQQSGGQQSGGQQSGGQQSGGQQSGGQQSGGQPSGGQPSGGQKNDEKQNGGQQTGGQQSGKPAGNEQRNDPSKDANRAEQQPADSATSPQSAGQGARGGQETKSPPQSGSSSGKKPNASASPPPQPPRPRPKTPTLPRFNGSLADWIRWLMYGAILAAAIFGFIRYRTQVLAFLRQMLEELKSIWRDLFGRKRPLEADAGADEPRPIPHPFAAFADPFTNGAAARSTPDQLVRYTFAALEAWAFERGAARRPEATPHEFAQQLGAGAPELAADVQSLANLYAQITYARGSLTPECLPTLKRLWRRLRAPEAAVVSIQGVVV